jgi:hypothetical protein
MIYFGYLECKSSYLPEIRAGLTKPGEVGDFFDLVLVALSVFLSPYFFHQ